MTPREKFITALQGRQPPGRVPHFELVFYLTMEAFGRVHPLHRSFEQWEQMSPIERDMQHRDMADLYVQQARRYEQSGLLVHGVARGWNHDYVGEMTRLLTHIRQISGQDYFLSVHGDATWSLPSGGKMMDFVEQIADRPAELHERAARRVDAALADARRYRAAGVLDGFCLCADYCFNTGPFLSPPMFDEFVTPYLARLTAGYRAMGFYVIKHTDGNIMPILDSLLSTKPHALHSLDPQGGVDIAEVKRRVGSQVCLIGNVSCAMLDTGTDADVIESARYALRHGMPGGGYIFATSNCIYTGMALRRYELMLDVWRKEGNYPE